MDWRGDARPLLKDRMVLESHLHVKGEAALAPGPNSATGHQQVLHSIPLARSQRHSPLRARQALSVAHGASLSIGWLSSTALPLVGAQRWPIPAPFK